LNIPPGVGERSRNFLSVRPAPAFVPPYRHLVTCRVVGAAEARTLAVCEMDGRSVADRLEDPEAVRAGQKWR